MNVKNLLFVILSCSFHIISAQTWQWLQTAGNEHQNNVGRAICHDLSGNVIVTGYHHPHLHLSVYPQQQELFSLINQVNKEQRFFLAKYAAHGNLQWAALSRGGRAAGIDVCSGKNDAIFVCGNASGKVNFDKGDQSSQLLTANPAGQGFLARYHRDNQLSWIAGLAQTGGKSQTQAIRKFEDMLLVIGDLELQAGSPVVFFDANGKKHSFTPVLASPGYEAKLGFLAMYSIHGDFVGAKFFGNNKSQLALQDIAIHPSGMIFLSAKFSGEWFFQGQTFKTDPFIEDGLLLALNKKGKLRWAKQLKASLDKNAPLKLASSGTGVFLSFASRGSIDILENGKKIQTKKSGKPLSAILKWNAEGQAVWQHFLSANWGWIATKGLTVNSEDQLTACGYFLGKWFAKQSQVSTSGFHSMPFGRYGTFSWWDENAFWIQLSADGKLRWQENSEGIYREAAWDISSDENGFLATTGTFERKDVTHFGPMQPQGKSGTNIFVAKLRPQFQPMVIDPGEVDTLVRLDSMRTIQEENSIAISGDEIEILLWDNNEIDGDTISLFCNDKCILSHHPLSHQQTRIQLQLEAGQIFRLHFQAENTGKIYPNTAAMTVVDKRYRQTVFLASDLHKTQAVKLVVEAPEGEPIKKE